MRLTRFVYLTALGVACSADTFTGGDSGGGKDAGVDGDSVDAPSIDTGSVDSASDAPGTPCSPVAFCKGQVTMPNYCSDFDGENVLGDWTGVSQTTGANISIQAAFAVSCPHGVQSLVPAHSGDAGVGDYATTYYDYATLMTHAILQLDVYIPSTSKGANAVFFGVRPKGDVTKGAYLVRHESGAFFVESTDGTTSIALSILPLLDAWNRMTLDVILNSLSSTNAIKLTYIDSANGQTAVMGLGATASSTLNGVTIEIGVHTRFGTSPSFTAYYDNVNLVMQ
jgi:hypothetical protein